MKSPPFCAIINLLDYDSTERGFFMSRKNPAKNINIGLLAHVDAGKTTLSEALLYATGQIRALGVWTIRMHFWIRMRRSGRVELRFFPSRRGFGCK